MSAFKNLNKWEPQGGTEITIGAEQWPDCLNPVTECANSSWMVWTAQFPLLPACGTPRPTATRSLRW